jgi:hypothetical protein
VNNSGDTQCTFCLLQAFRDGHHAGLKIDVLPLSRLPGAIRQPVEVLLPHGGVNSVGGAKRIETFRKEMD